MSEKIRGMVPVSVEDINHPDVDAWLTELAEQGIADLCSEKGFTPVEGSLHEVRRVPVTLVEDGDHRRPVPLDEAPAGAEIHQYLVYFESEAVAA